MAISATRSRSTTANAIAPSLLPRSACRPRSAQSAHRELKIPIGDFGGSALTDHGIAVPEQASAGIPVTYVPARNTVFLSLALAWAEVLDAARS